MDRLNKEIESFYSQGLEQRRLWGEHGEIERIRTQSILARHLPPAPAVIFDIGGAAGIYAFPLSKLGYAVHLVDPMALHIEQARAYAAEAGVTLASIARGDARKLDAASSTADAVLLLGPLYHLTERTDRLLALREAHRILKPGGILVAAAITRFASLIEGLSYGFFGDGRFRDIIRTDLATGRHRNPDRHPAWFTTAYFHRPEDLASEIREAGFDAPRLIGVEGPAWSGAHFREAVTDPAQREDLLAFLALIEEEPSIVGASAHLIAVTRRQ